MLTLIGRSSSHFTRIARIFALELGLEHRFRPVFDIMATDPAVYGENPALKIPVLVDERGSLFGTENVCRELVRRSGSRAVVERGQSRERVVANAEELTLHVMTAAVTVIMAKPSGAPPAKLLRGMENSLAWLDANIDAALAALPQERAFSFLEVASFCLVTHLPFRDVMDVSRWARLAGHCARFAERESAKSTDYRFDVPPN